MKEQNKIKYQNFSKVIIMILISIIITGCVNTSNRDQFTTISSNKNVINEEKVKYDSEFLGVIKSIDTEMQIVTILDIKSGTDFILSYNGATDITNKYDAILAMSQMDVGEIVDVYFVKESNKLIKLQKSKKSWEYQDVGNLIIDRTNKIMKIADRKYRYFDSLVVLSDEQLRELIDINKQDILTVKGVGANIYSITITRGHGYIRLQNYKDFIGGFIEVGYGIIEPVSEDMLIVAREGDYKLTMQNGQLIGSKRINVVRDQEMLVDMGEFKNTDNEIGKVDFIIEPQGAELRINGAAVDYSKTIKLNYGRHAIRVSLDGYSEFNGILKIAKSHQVIKINLVEPSKSEVVENETDNILDNQVGNTNENQSNNEAENNTDSNLNNEVQNNTESPETSQTPQATDSNNTEEKDNTELTDVPKEDASTSETVKVDSDHKMSVKSPVGAKMYLNGTYKGTVPVDIPKEIGNHTITFQQEGYETKSYQLEVIDDGSDAYFSYPNMIKSK